MTLYFREPGLSNHFSVLEVSPDVTMRQILTSFKVLRRDGKWCGDAEIDGVRIATTQLDGPLSNFISPNQPKTYLLVMYKTGEFGDCDSINVVKLLKQRDEWFEFKRESAW